MDHCTTVGRSEVRAVGVEQLSALIRLGPPDLQQHYWYGSGNSETVAICAFVGGAPIGYAVAELDRVPIRTAVVRSFVLASPRDHQSSSIAVVKALEAELRERDCEAVEISVVGNSEPRALAWALRGAGWPNLEPKGLLCETDYQHLSKAPWMNHRKLPPGSDIFFWKDLSPTQRAGLACERRQKCFPRSLDPCIAEERIDAETSVGLRAGDEVLGWCIYHRITESCTACVALFVRHALQGQGYAIALAARSIQLHSSCPAQRIVFDVPFVNAHMMKFVRRGLLPYTTSARLIRRSRQGLRDSPPFCGEDAWTQP